MEHSPAMPNPRSIPHSVKQRIWNLPCAVCGVPWDIKVDHIQPVARGGSAALSNLQPLCHACNHIKGCRLSNDEIADVVQSRGLRHFLMAAWRFDTRYINSYDAPSMERWLGSSPPLEVKAARLYVEFIEGR
jgi:hypothetical protein